MIKKLYKTEKENHKYKNKYKTNKKMVKVYDRVEKMKKTNKNLFEFNKELMDIICEQNALIENMETEIKGNEKTMKKLSANHDNRKKNVSKTNNTHNETKIILMIMLCWLLMLFMFQYSFINDVSFMIFNFCAILSGLFMEIMYWIVWLKVWCYFHFSHLGAFLEEDALLEDFNPPPLEDFLPPPENSILYLCLYE